VSPAIVGLALCAAVLHATWNAVLRSGTDRLWSVTIMSFATTIVAAPIAIFLPLPLPASWPYLFVSSCLQVGYSIFLVYAYRYGNLGQVYPIVRGSVPVLVTIGGFLLAGQHPALRPLFGVALVAIGITSLAAGTQRPPFVSILLALATGLIIALYTTTDAIAVRYVGNARAYATWIFLIYGALMPAAFVVLRGLPRVDVCSSETAKAMAGGVVQLVAYGAVISAFALGPAGPISALRETSVVFAALIGRFFLDEVLTFRRIAACAIVTLGAFCISYQ
jgi:drug/metabolite transporter (DMT)-like permease